MGLFDSLFGKRPRPESNNIETFFKTLQAYTPVFYTRNGSIYESERVRSAIDARARHMSKLNIVISGAAKPTLITKLRLAPNSWQTWSQFLYRASTILDMQNNCFIVPTFDRFGEIDGYYPILPSRAELVESSGRVWLRYKFSSGDIASIEFNKCGILTKFQYRDDFFGESNGALNPTMDLININNQGIKEGVKSSATYRFMAKVTNFTKTEDLAKERQRFTKENFESDNGGGVLLFPNTYGDIRQIDSKPFTLAADQIKLIDNNVYNYFGVNEKILQNNANDEELDAFFNGAIEPLSIQMSEVLTKMTFSSREIAQGNKIYVASNRLQYMSVTHKIQMAQQLGDRGMMTINEIRALFNYPPLENGDKATIRGEYYFVGDKKEGEENEDTGQ